jgi:hypothetical protein
MAAATDDRWTVDAAGVERDAAGVRAPQACRSHGSGHDAHWIQWKQGRRRPEQQRPAIVTDVTGDGVAGVITVRLADGELDLHHHDPDRVRDIVTVEGREVHYQPEFSLLWFETYLVSVSRRPLGPCSPGQTTGGATVAGADAAELADIAERLSRRPPAEPSG